LSPPGAPDTPTPPMATLPTRMGTPPPMPTVSGIRRSGALAGFYNAFMKSSEVWLRVRAV
jgi:hypothetical protein